MKYIDLGLSEYKDAYRFQREIVDKVASGGLENTLIITEHESVITIGRQGSWDNILRPKEFLAEQGVQILDIDRGGDVTYHGPGQLVAYPIFKLENEAKDIHNFLDFLEEVGINFLAKYGVISVIRPGLRGIWVDKEKIGSIGIGIKKWVTYHGMAININPDLTPFSFIKPCGIEGVRVTSLQDLLEERIDIDDSKDKLRESFEEVPLLAAAINKK